MSRIKIIEEITIRENQSVLKEYLKETVIDYYA
jgi:hypothetical protein